MPDPATDSCPEELDAALEQVDQLKVALASSRHIGAAIGIVMASRRCTEQEAFDLIREHSQVVNIKIKVLAERLIETGDTADYARVAGDAATRRRQP